MHGQVVKSNAKRRVFLLQRFKQRNAKVESASSSDPRRGEVQGSSMQADDVSTNPETQTRPSASLLLVLVDLRELAEDL
jgi:hypothetical protein